MRGTNTPNDKPKIYTHSCKTFTDCVCTCPELANTSEVKYLGVVLVTNLNFRQHIDLLCTRTRKFLYIAQES